MANPAHYIWINGFPGVGKLTVASELQKRLEDSVLIDNHQLIDVVKLPRDHPEYDIERKRARTVAFAKWIYTDSDEEPAEKTRKSRRVVIFRDCVTESDLGRSMAKDHRAAAAKAGRPFCLKISNVHEQRTSRALLARSGQKVQRAS